MGARSSIEWTEATWNPVTGCSKVSQGCKFCYAERLTERFGTQKFTDIVLHPDRLDLPLHWRKPRRIFVNSMSDLFHEKIPVDYIARVFNVMADARCEGHTFQVLTKRADRMWRVVKQLLPDHVGESWGGDTALGCCLEAGAWPLPTVWLGVSVESPDHYDRIEMLRETPAAIRFLSLEPLLAPMPDLPLAGISWCIVGGESGGPPERALVEWSPCIGARDCSHGASARTTAGRGWHPKADAIDWVREIRDQCVAADVPFSFKQFGGPTPKSGGRLLDGREWGEYPDANRQA